MSLVESNYINSTNSDDYIIELEFLENLSSNSSDYVPVEYISENSSDENLNDNLSSYDKYCKLFNLVNSSHKTDNLNTSIEIIEQPSTINRRRSKSLNINNNTYSPKHLKSKDRKSVW